VAGPGLVAGVSATRVLIVDDQAVIRAGLRLIVDNEPDLTVVGEAGNGHEAVRVAAAARPDVVLMDIRMPAMNGIDATAQIVRAGSAAVLVLTTFEDDQYVFGSLRAGASAFLLKDVEPDVLVGAIRSVARGDALIDPAVTRRLVERWVELDQHARPSGPPLQDELTDREREVLVGLARGLSNRDLAARLFLSEATVKTHVSNLLTKLGVRSRVQAVILAYERGVVRPGDEGNIGWT
jgi:DNA-binding NarL/FixJ family response regulator